MFMASPEKKPVDTMKPAKATIWAPPCTGSLEKAARPFGTSSNLMSMDGER